MCDVIQFVRIFLFVICWVLLVSAVLYASAYSKKNGINMNTFSGMLEVWGKVFKFESRKLSILLLTAAYGGGSYRYRYSCVDSMGAEPWVRL